MVTRKINEHPTTIHSLLSYTDFLGENGHMGIHYREQ